MVPNEDDESPEAKGWQIWARQKLDEVEELHLLLNTILDAVLEETPEFGDQLLEALKRTTRGKRKPRQVDNVRATIKGAIDRRRQRP